MKICYFGTYEKKYSRNRIIINGLISNNVEVTELHEPIFKKLENKIKLKTSKKIIIVLNIIYAYLKLVFKKFKLHNIDCIIIGYIGQLDMILARILFPTKKIIFNPMISLYDTMINDRQISENYFIKKLYFLLDKISCSLANKIILDTPEHAEYFRKKFKIPKKKLDYVYIGADEKIFYPPSINKQREKKFKVLFYGKFTPLHGIEHIIKAAKILENENIDFEIVGKGQTYNKIRELVKELNVKNINFIDWINYKELPKKINEADACIGGHFGGSKKASRVIANKVFQIIAMSKPAIVSDSKTLISAGFVHEKNALLCPHENPKILARQILKLKNNQELEKKISGGAYNLFKKNFSTKKIGDKFYSIIRSEVDENI